MKKNEWDDIMSGLAVCLFAVGVFAAIIVAIIFC